MTGKEKCKSLQQIRQKIADANGIAYAPEPCTYEGEDCTGTCPKCDADLAYLEAELSKKCATGVQSSLTGLATDLLENTAPDESAFSPAPVTTMGEIDCEEPVQELTIEDLDLSVRTYNFLKHAGINTVAELIQMTHADLQELFQLSPRNLDELRFKLLMLGVELEESPAEPEDR